MPPKIRDLVRELGRAGFANRGGKGSHRNFIHPCVKDAVTLSGSAGDDAKPYQVSMVRKAIREVQS
jgi:predicted RNA binding protein YcfA (HicA-like mRNA interferase family)